MKFPSLAGDSMIAVAALAAAVALMSSGLARQSPTAQKPLAEPAQTSQAAAGDELKIYDHARTILDYTPKEIRRAPMLRGVKPAGDERPLAEILDHAGKAAQAQLQQFPRISCREEVSSRRMRRSRETAYLASERASKVYSFRYIIIPRESEGTFVFDEYRTEMNGKPVKASEIASLGIVTVDTNSAWLYFAPPEQAGSRFRELGAQKIGGHACYVIGFAQRPRVTRYSSLFKANNRLAVIMVQGVAWIDQQSFHVRRIETWRRHAGRLRAAPHQGRRRPSVGSARRDADDLLRRPADRGHAPLLRFQDISG
jgi:hypothetical protein